MNKQRKFDDAKREEMREAAFADSINYSNKPRFGLFSQPHPIAAGDTNYYA